MILGISPDGVESHARWKRKLGLEYTLLADVGHSVAEMYGVWGEKKLFGVPYRGVLRTTFVIDRNGVVARVFENVKTDGHAAEVARAVAAVP